MTVQSEDTNGHPVRRQDGKVIGQVVGTEFRKSITNNHMLNIPPALCSAVVSLRQAQGYGATTCVWTNRDTGIVYSVSVERFLKDGIRKDYGYGDQVCLPLKGWTVRKAREPQMALPGLLGILA